MTVPNIDEKFISTFADATKETLAVQCAYKVKYGKPFLRGKGKAIVPAIIGVIGISSPSFSGSISVAFTEKIFLELMGNMLGEPFAEITEELEDGVGELINIIFGVVKKTLSQIGYQFHRAIPSVIRGNNISVHSVSTKPVIIIPFFSETSPDTFQIEIVFE
jgi:CheY-specific phosphatase CheX